MTIEVTDREGKVRAMDWAPGQSLMEVLRDADLVLASCGGNAVCGTCHVLLAGGAVAKLAVPSPDETETLRGAAGFCEGSSRLSCQIPFSRGLDGMRVRLAPDS